MDKEYMIKEELSEIQSDLLDLTDDELIELRKVILDRVDTVIDLFYQIYPKDIFAEEHLLRCKEVDINE